MDACTLENRVMKVMVVDGEKTERATMLALLSRMDGVSVVAEARTAREAIAQLRTVEVDAVFLDVNLPDATGITLARALQTLRCPPAVVFASTHSEYALEAFDVHAMDFLVKPLRTSRLAEALARVRQQLELDAFHRRANRIPVDSGNKKIFIPVCDIRFAEANSDYAYVQTETDRYFVVSSLGRLEKSLGEYGFFRVHRSFLVNLDQVEEVEPRAGGALSLTLHGVRSKIPVSRRRAAQVKHALGV